MTSPYLDEIVPWRTEVPDTTSRLRHAVLPPGGLTSLRGRLPADTTTVIGYLGVTGYVLEPDRRGELLTVAVLRDRAVVEPGPRSGSRRLPLERMQPTAARALGDLHYRPDAVWELDALLDEAYPLTLVGPWLCLAWLGHLGGWPEPEPGHVTPPVQLRVPEPVRAPARTG